MHDHRACKPCARCAAGSYETHRSLLCLRRRCRASCSCSRSPCPSTWPLRSAAGLRPPSSPPSSRWCAFPATDNTARCRVWHSGTITLDRRHRGVAAPPTPRLCVVVLPCYASASRCRLFRPRSRHFRGRSRVHACISPLPMLSVISSQLTVRQHLSWPQPTAGCRWEAAMSNADVRSKSAPQNSVQHVHIPQGGGIAAGR